MISDSNDVARELSARAQTERRAAGLVEHDGVRLHDGTIAGVGDRIVTRLNRRNLVAVRRQGLRQERRPLGSRVRATPTAGSRAARPPRRRPCRCPPPTSPGTSNSVTPPRSTDPRGSQSNLSARSSPPWRPGKPRWSRCHAAHTATTPTSTPSRCSTPTNRRYCRATCFTGTAKRSVAEQALRAILRPRGRGVVGHRTAPRTPSTTRAGCPPWCPQYRYARHLHRGPAGSRRPRTGSAPRSLATPTT